MSTKTENRTANLLRIKEMQSKRAIFFACMAMFLFLSVSMFLRRRGLAQVYTLQVLDCPAASASAHVHDEGCFDASGNLLCPLSEGVEHVHGAGCFQSVAASDAAGEGLGDVLGGARTDGLETVDGIVETEGTDRQGTGDSAIELGGSDEDAQTGVTSAMTMVGEGDTARVTIEAPAEAQIPQGSTVQVLELDKGTDEYEAYQARALEALSAEGAKLARFFDITILDPDGVEVQPQAPVHVEIKLDDAPTDGTPSAAVHFDEDGGAPEPEVLPAEVSDKTTNFDAESFSVYGVVYTVDFHWEDSGQPHEFSIPGGGCISLQHLVEVIGVDNLATDATESSETDEIAVEGMPQEHDEAAYNEALNLDYWQISDATRQFVSHVANVEFSNPDYLWVKKVDAATTVGDLKKQNNLHVNYSTDLSAEQIAQINAQMIEAGDWALIGMQPFDSEETLVITMDDGAMFTILVTDLNENPFGLDGKSFKIVNDSQAMSANTASEIWNAGKMFDQADSLNNGMTWTFEYTGVGTKFLMKDSRGRYLLMIPKATGESTPGVEWGLQMTSDRNLAEMFPVVVKETIDSNGTRGYAILDSTSTYPLTHNYGKYYLNGNPYAANTTSPLYCMELRNPSSTGKPGLIGTADTKADGITFNLFDYYATNSSGNDILDEEGNSYNNNNGSIPSTYDIGINKNHALKFMSHGTGPSSTSNVTLNNWSDPALMDGNYTAIQGIVNPALDSNGYPTLSKDDTSLDYLFNTSNISGAKTAYTDLNHLFIKDDKGYYRYDSNENYAYYNNDGTFNVYAGTFNEEQTTEDEAVGFFPFNDYDSYYDCIHGGYPGRHGSFQWYGPHDGTDSDRIGHYNHQFGMSMDASFIMTPDGKYLGDDIVFNFSGDDDLWVFVDGVLVLDIGGIHNPVTGQINFNTGQITVKDAVHNTTPAQMVVSGGQPGPKTLKEAFERVTGKDWNDDPYSKHSLKVFYLERGGMYSNLAISFNLPTYRTITIEKELEGLTESQQARYQDEYFYYRVDINGQPYSGQYGVLTRPATQEELDAWVPEYTTYDDETQVYTGGHWTDPNHTNTETINKDGELVKWHVEVENGMVRIKPGWYFTIEELKQGDTFRATELYGYQPSYVFHDGQPDTPQTANLMEPFYAPFADYSYKNGGANPHYEVLPLTEIVSGNTKSWRSDTRELQHSDRAIFYNSLPTKLKVKKVWTDDDSVDHSGDSIEYKIFRMPYYSTYEEDTEEGGMKEVRHYFATEEVTSSNTPTMTGYTGSLSNSNSWEQIVEKLPTAGKWQDTVVRYQYYVTEGELHLATPPAGVDPIKYKTIVEGGEITEAGDHQGEYDYTITNEPMASTDKNTQIGVKKKWKYADGEDDTRLHKDDAVQFNVTQKKYQAKVMLGSGSQAQARMLYPITINLIDKAGDANGRRVNNPLSTVVYVPEGAQFTLIPRYERADETRHTVKAAGITVPPGSTYPSVVQSNEPGYTYYYTGVNFTIDNVDSAKEVSLTVYSGYDVWTALYDRDHLGTDPVPQPDYRKWTCEMYSPQGIIWELDEMIDHVIEGLDGPAHTEPTLVDTVNMPYSMSLTNDEDGKPTVITNGVNAQGQGVGSDDETWKGSIQNLIAYEYKKDAENPNLGGDSYIYTYDVQETAIRTGLGSEWESVATDGHGSGNYWDGETSHYLVRWDQDLEPGLWTLTNQEKDDFTVALHKVDKDHLERGYPLLPGSEFTLVKYTLEGDGNTRHWVKDTTWETQGEKALTEDALHPGIFDIGDLDLGYYELNETQYPDGYIQTTENQMFQLRRNATTHKKEVVLVHPSGQNIGNPVADNRNDMVKIEQANGIATVTLGNEPGSELPSAGGTGTAPVTLIGAALVALAVAGYALARKAWVSA